MSRPDLELILDGGHVRSVYQPIVDLRTNEVVAYEALARGPVGSSLERPDQLFDAAADAGLTGELDWACRAAALHGALERDMGDVALFINLEPSTLRTPSPERHESLLGDAVESGIHFVAEITERALLLDPAILLQSVEAIRQHGWQIALDDVGADPASLAVMPLLRPDVIKLDMALIREATTREAAWVMNAVMAQAELTGATILAEGIEDRDHLRRALSLGAVLGQGWMFERPGSLPDPVVQPSREASDRLPRGEATVSTWAAGTPYEQVVARRGPGRTASKRMLLQMSHHIERKAIDTAERPIVLSSFQQARNFTPDTTRRYTELGEWAMLVGALAEGLAAEPAPGVRGRDLDPDDPLVEEWIVCVITPHFAAALVAHEKPPGVDCPDCPDDEGIHFDYHIVYDRETAIDVARRMTVELHDPRAEHGGDPSLARRARMASAG